MITKYPTGQWYVWKTRKVTIPYLSRILGMTVDTPTKIAGLFRYRVYPRSLLQSSPDFVVKEKT